MAWITTLPIALWVLFFGLQGALRRDVHRRRLEDVGERVAVARRRGLAVLSVLAGVGTIYVLAGGSSIEWGHLGRHNPGELLFLGTAVSAPVLAALLTPARRR